MDLERELAAAKARALALREQHVAAERELTEIAELKDQLRKLLSEAHFSPDEARKIERGLASESLVELRELTSIYRQQRERAAELAREQQREIRWLESEFKAIPPLEREEAHEAWELYKKAVSVDDPKEKLNWLKEARKKLPKDLRTN